MPAIHLILGLGIIGSLGLSSCWDRTSYVFGSEHSVALFAFLFLFSFVDCISSVLYVPYTGKWFGPRQLFFLFFGESLSSFIPSALSLIQGCGNAKGDQSSLNFSVSTYFLILAILLSISWAAFQLLNSKLILTKKDERDQIHSPEEEKSVVWQKDESQESLSPDRKQDAEQQVEEKSESDILQTPTSLHLTKFQTIFLFAILTYINCMGNGVLRAFQTYTAKPYGQAAFHLSINLTLILSTTALLLTYGLDHLSKQKSNFKSNLNRNQSASTINIISSKHVRDWPMLSLYILAVIQLLFSFYLILLIVMHRHPIGVNTWYGPVLMIVSWIGFKFFGSVCKTLICITFRRRASQDFLFYYGVLTQVGSFVGSFLSFLIINFTDYFK